MKITYKMIDKCRLKISTKEDVEQLNFEEKSKINHFHLEIDKDLDDSQFKNLFGKITLLDLYNRFHLDLQSCLMTDERAEIISGTIKSFNLREINFNFSNSQMSDKQFEILLTQTLPQVKGLEKLHLILENMELDKNKLKTINDVLNYLPNLNHIFVNIKKNKIPMNEITDLNTTLNRFISKEMHF